MRWARAYHGACIDEHLKNIFASGELDEQALIRKFRMTAADRKNYQTQHYNQDAPTSCAFFVKAHYAIHGSTAVELIVERARDGGGRQCASHSAI